MSTFVDGWQGDGMRWLVYGAGAIGGVLGGRLFEAGEDTVLVARGPHLRELQEHGLRLLSPVSDRVLEVPAVGSASEVDHSVPTTVLLAVKSHQTQAAVDDLFGTLGPDTPVVSVQNGVANEPTLLRFFGDVQGVCVMMPTGHLEAGAVEQYCHPVPGLLDVGRYPHGTDATTQQVSEAFRRAGFESVPRDDVMAWKRRKLVLNLGNAAQACCGEGDGADELTRRARAEGEAALDASGLTVITEAEDRERRGNRLQLGEIAGRERGGGSSWQSLRRETGSVESDYLNGEVVRLGREHGVPTPCNELLRRTAVGLARSGGAPGSIDARELLSRLA
jgi:2-dehydropantoate 2-reductase